MIPVFAKTADGKPLSDDDARKLYEFLQQHLESRDNGSPTAPDPINPSHYQGKVECIEAIEAMGIGVEFCQGNAVKYLWRLGHKDSALQDAKKAQWYVDRLVALLEERQSR